MSYSVLIVDDSPLIRSMVLKSIAMSGLEILASFQAANGLEALEILREQWIDVVFADLNMPEMGGIELVERMSADSLLVSVPVVIVSSVRDEAHIEALKRKGIRAYIKKPFRPESFREVVEVLTRAAEVQR
ncbi:MAG: response regulator [Deltaproteobacteria bacterium]|nr:response regulator [Deltaproteobacteria bacterium]